MMAKWKRYNLNCRKRDNENYQEINELETDFDDFKNSNRIINPTKQIEYVILFVPRKTILMFQELGYFNI
jgi:hypothetical protein